MTDTIDTVLAPLRSKDPFLMRAQEVMASLIGGTEAAKQLNHVRLYLLDYGQATLEVRQGRYFTENCAALFDDQAIVVNEACLLETEAAMRSFGLAGDLLETPCLRSDEEMSGLVDRIRSDAFQYVSQLRLLLGSLPGREGAEAQAVDSFAMLLIFLVGHELGHLGQSHDHQGFNSFVDPEAPLETRLGSAVVKLARHAREFARLGFDLPGFEKAIAEASEVGSNGKLWQEALHGIQHNHQRWFEDESGADDHATVLVQHVLDRTAATDPARADRLLVCVVNALFSAAIYHWQRGLTLFLKKLGLERLNRAQDLATALMQGREHHIHAAELFGDRHRFTLLRAMLAIDAWLHARGVVRAPLYKSVPRIEPVNGLPPMDSKDAARCLQRLYLLRIHMETAVKIASVGSATGWMVETDKAQDLPQLHLMQFESIRQSSSRLRRMM